MILEDACTGTMKEKLRIVGYVCLVQQKETMYRLQETIMPVQWLVHLWKRRIESCGFIRREKAKEKYSYYGSRAREGKKAEVTDEILSEHR